MNFSNVSSRKPDNNSISLVGLVWRNKHVDAACFGLGKRLREICHLISRHLSAVGVWKVTVSNERSQLPELRFDPHSSVGLRWFPDFNAGRLRIIAQDGSVRENKNA